MTDRRSIVGELDTLCDAFESEWNSGREPSIQEYLTRWTESVQRPALRELLFLDVYYRRKHDQSPGPDDYRTHFPEDVVSDAFELLNRSEETVEGRVESPGDESQQSTIVFGSGSATRTAPETSVEENRFGDYELLHEIARGGMGVVYKARQSKLDRVVALKMIKSGELAGEDEIQRFHAEAEAAAKLDHPNIVPIYEVGEQSGQHFFSMGFVEGEGLDARLKQGPLESREAAGLIQAIAEAVQYAHDKGIVHRDLKPANVLLAADGTPRITDFGLAKNIAADSGLTATGQVLGTPSYMPPEQAAGNSEEIGPLADVYALGALLYAALAGRPPFQAANVMETLKQVMQSEPVSPRTMNPAVDRDLETICLKCLEKEPNGRYASAHDLADELERFRQHKPILARPVGRLERSRRWCKRNPLGAVVAGLVLFLAIAGPTVAAYQIDTNRRLDSALAGETEQRKKAEDNEQKARDSERIMALALKNEQAALARKNQALLETEAAIDRYVQTVKEARLLKEARFKPLLKRLLADALSHYQRFIKEHQHEQDESTRVRLVKALLSIAQISEDHGSRVDTVAAYRRMLQIADLLVRSNQNVAEYRAYQAAAHHNLGIQYRDAGDFQESLRAFRKSIAIYERLTREHPDAAEYSAFAARARVNIGDLYVREGDVSKALSEFRHAVRISSRLSQQHPTVPDYQSVLARSHHNIGLLLSGINETAKAHAAHQEALRIRQRLAREHSDNPRHQLDLSVSHHALGQILVRLGKPADALEAYQHAIRIQELLSDENPTVDEFQSELANSLYSVGVASRMLRKTTSSLAATRRSIAIRESLARNNPHVADYRFHWGSSLNSLGITFRKSGKPAEALAAYQDALELREPLAREHPTQIRYQTGLANVLKNMAVILHQKDPEAALKQLSKAVEILSEVIKTNPRDGLIRSNLASTYGLRGQIYAERHRYREAAASFRKSLQFDSGRYRFRTLINLMRALAASGEHGEASKVHNDIVELSRNPAAVGTQFALFDLACAYAFAAFHAEHDRQLEETPRKRYLKGARRNALRWLKVLARAGFFRVDEGRHHLINNVDLNAIRHLDEFRVIARSGGVVVPAWALMPQSATQSPTRQSPSVGNANSK